MQLEFLPDSARCLKAGAGIIADVVQSFETIFDTQSLPDTLLMLSYFVCIKFVKN